MKLFWLEKHLAQWHAALANDHKPQAVIVNAPPGMGKHNLLQQILADLLCRVDQNGHCGTCQNCRLLAAGHHPDVDWVRPEKNLIKVKAIRELTEFFTSTPHCSDYKVAIIDQAESMNTAAANALLKVLEEPPSRGLLFLVTESRHQLMPTIKSRCITLDVVLNAAEKQQLADWLTAQTGQDQAAVNDALILTDWQPMTCQSLLETGHLQQFQQQLDVLVQVLNEHISTAQGAKSLNEGFTLNDWSMLQRHGLHLMKSQWQAMSHEVFANHSLNQIIKNSPKVTHIIIKLNELIQQFMLNFNTQIKPQLLLESLLIEIKNELNHGR
ncbi:DNA polymerase III subunit delta' [Marinicella meishanensis]|uniref:DNA polymerase III subunit delta' n=1 Tax=Marinicella meishanensis TaxID=2873263 RepID=UPI001CBC05D2|nr:DNA polymerase III subunit delta' [Marinicella sp. NBU2979]